MITLDRVTKSFDGGRTWAVRELSLEIGTRELLAVVGESGSGKTTTLKMINRLIERTSGTIAIDGEDVARGDPAELRRGIGYVFQNVGLFPHFTVARNVAVVPELLGWDRAAIDARVAELLELVGLPDLANRYPDQLSAGQKQRIGLARALAGKPKIVLMDESFGALDPVTRDSLQREYLALHRRLELTSVMVTHDMSEALLMADRVAVMLHGELVRAGSPRELLADPGHEYVESLLSTPRRQAERLDALIAP